MSNPQKIRILVTDDHKMVRQGLIACLEEYENLKIVGEAASGREAIQKYADLKPDVMIMDISMPDMNAFEATPLILNKFPQAKILILSAHKESEYINKMARSGAMGYVFKDSSTDELFKAIDSVHKGKKYYNSEVSAILLEGIISPEQGEDNKALLTAREKEIVTYIAEGFLNKEIADKLGLSVKTVGVHREHIMEKLKLHNPAGLVRYAVENGFVKSGDK
jgi:two-component system, NarL family, nitrate/nitrite response regulator NarL